MIGVLALQGGFERHRAVFESLRKESREVRTVGDLELCGALVIPGGESTVITRHLMKPGTGPGTGASYEPGPLWKAIRDFIESGKPVMGTCAGLIMLARSCGDERVASFGALPVDVERNAYGRQKDSFVEQVALEFGSDSPFGRENENGAPFPATFIRAPMITGLGEGVAVLARSRRFHSGEQTEGTPILARYNNILGLSFHPELNPEDSRIHRYFLGMTRE